MSRAFEFAVVTGLIALAAAVYEKPKSTVSIEGVRLGDTRSAIEAQRGQGERIFSCGRWIQIYHSQDFRSKVFVEYDDKGSATRVVGDHLELRGQRVLGSDSNRAHLEKRLGPAEQSGYTNAPVWDNSKHYMTHHRQHRLTTVFPANGNTLYRLESAAFLREP